MKNIRPLLVVLALLLGITFSAQAGPTDSIGTKVRNGKIFILHKVEKAQGLFSISRRYGVALNDIIKANPGSDEVLLVDQILMIPTGKDAPMEEPAVKEYFSEEKPIETQKVEGEVKKSTFARYHTVAKGETLYSISVLYKTKVDVIKNLNGLQTDVLKIGQQIMVPATEEENVQQEEQMMRLQHDMDDTRFDMISVQKEIREKSKTEKDSDIQEVVMPNYEVKIEKLPKYNVEKIWERGIVATFDVNRENQANLRVCSHHLARIGSTIMVTNPTNKKSVFVKVVENHELNKEVGNVILLSPTATTDIEIQEGTQVEVSFAR